MCRAAERSLKLLRSSKKGEKNDGDDVQDGA